MPHVFNRCVSSVGLRICLITAAFFGIMRAGAQERATPDSNRSRTPALPPSLLDSMRNQTNPFQPQKLQSLLIKPEVQAELEIDRNTYGMVSSALKELNEKQMEISKGFVNMDRTDREAARKHLEQYNALRAERDRATEEALNEVFPPEKFKRLKQIALQIQIQEAGMDNVLIHGVLGEAINLTDAQRERLASKADEYEAEKQARIRTIIEEYDDKLMGQLTSNQRKQVEEQLGEPFDYKPVSMERRSFQQTRDFRKRFSPPAPE